MRPRLIPVLLLSRRKVVKTLRFEDPKYIGDPVNIVRIFNGKEVDEIVILDIDATREKRVPDFRHLAEIAGECFMPMAYGGGLRSLDDMKQAFRAGVEKVVLNTAAVEHPDLVTAAAQRFGSQSVVVSLDFRTTEGMARVATISGSRDTSRDPVSAARHMEHSGAGEIILTSIDRDGSMSGYDLEMTRAVANSIDIPLIACGGAGSLDDCARVVKEAGAAAAAAGSFFIFCGNRDAILVTYPDSEDLKRIGLIEDENNSARRNI
ncbi:MAG: AglZ/HisF2 family acetamidino modification protein [Candidatus Hydrogenedentota bacterium]